MNDKTVLLWLENVKNNRKRNIFVQKVQKIINKFCFEAYKTTDKSYRSYCNHIAYNLSKELENAVSIARNLPFSKKC